MAPPLTKEQVEILNTKFYENHMMFGRDKLFIFLRNKYEDKSMSRRQIAEWLHNQEVN